MMLIKAPNYLVVDTSLDQEVTFLNPLSLWGLLPIISGPYGMHGWHIVDSTMVRPCNHPGELTRYMMHTEAIVFLFRSRYVQIQFW